MTLGDIIWLWHYNLVLSWINTYPKKATNGGKSSVREKKKLH